jgi:CheY-like chemotaxis protein
MKILLVDDDAGIVDELGHFLRRRGHEVVEAPGVAEARRILGGAARFDAVLTDLRMPDGSGLDVLRACRARPAPLPATILISGNASREDMARARGEGVRHIFAKPVPTRALLAALTDIARAAGAETGTFATASSRGRCASLAGRQDGCGCDLGPGK